ncbi:hypothetical protein D3C73_1133640 [compost metagenome]
MHHGQRGVGPSFELGDVDCVGVRPGSAFQHTPLSRRSGLLSRLLRIGQQAHGICQDLVVQEVVDDAVFHVEHLRGDGALGAEVQASDLWAVTRDVRVGIAAFMRCRTVLRPPFDGVADDGVLQVAQEVEDRGVLDAAVGPQLDTRVVDQAQATELTTVSTGVKGLFVSHVGLLKVFDGVVLVQQRQAHLFRHVGHTVLDVAREDKDVPSLG